jgi:hypothetical protein
MTDPITPPPELVHQWAAASPLQIDDETYGYELFIAHHAAQWGADQELEACCEWIQSSGYHDSLPDELRTARRPKPPRLKEQAMEELDGIAAVFRMSHGGDLVCDKIRRALEALDD